MQPLQAAYINTNASVRKYPLYMSKNDKTALRQTVLFENIWNSTYVSIPEGFWSRMNVAEKDNKIAFELLYENHYTNELFFARHRIRGNSMVWVPPNAVDRFTPTENHTLFLPDFMINLNKHVTYNVGRVVSVAREFVYNIAVRDANRVSYRW